MEKPETTKRLAVLLPQCMRGSLTRQYLPIVLRLFHQLLRLAYPLQPHIPQRSRLVQLISLQISDVEIAQLTPLSPRQGHACCAGGGERPEGHAARSGCRCCSHACHSVGCARRKSRCSEAEKKLVLRATLGCVPILSSIFGESDTPINVETRSRCPSRLGAQRSVSTSDSNELKHWPASPPHLLSVHYPSHLDEYSCLVAVLLEGKAHRSSQSRVSLLQPA